jgi:hypothetical protein
MLRSIPFVLALALAAGPQPPRVGSSVADCVQSWPEARYRGLGYNHIVHVRDVCDARAECTVSTNVNPERQAVTVPGHSEVEVTTFLGSPAREFTPKVDCRLVP